MAIRRRMEKSGPTGEGILPANAPLEFDGRPALADFLTAVVWEGSTDPREPGTISVYLKNGRVQFCLNDKAQQLLAYGTVPLEGSILDSAEEVLASEDTSWQAYKENTKKK